MRRRAPRAAIAAACLGLLAALLVACVANENEAEDGGPTASPTAEGPIPLRTPLPTATSIGRLDERDVPGLVRDIVCWWDDPALAAECLPPDGEALAAIDRLSAGGLGMVPFMIDLLTVDVGWERQVLDALERMTGERFAEARDAYEWEATNWRASTPEGYVEWKARLLSIAAPPEGAPTFDELINPNTNFNQPYALVWTGTQPNGVPPLDDPATVHRVEERYLDPSDVVYGLVVGGEARAYPRRILAWHGVLNDTIGGVPVVVTYCVPCGSASAFDRRGDGQTYTFGNAGLATGVETLMYDEETLKLWSTWTGQPAREGSALDGSDATDPRSSLIRLPLHATTWGEWSSRVPDTLVLSLDTGYVRDYDEGAAIAEQEADPRPLYGRPYAEFLAFDHGIPLKSQVLWMTVGEVTRVYPVAAIEERGAVFDRIDGASMVLLSRGPGTGVSVYLAGGTNFVRLQGSGTDLRAVDEDGELWFVDPRALVSTLDGRERSVVPVQQGYWWGGPEELDVWSP